MATYQAISTRDIVANVYSIPQFVPYLGHAIRSFGDQCRSKEKDNVLAKHPEDFELWHLGEYDDGTGTYTAFPMEQRKQLAVGANYRE